MFSSQMVRFKIVNIEWPTLSMFPSQMERLKIISRSMAHFFHVSLTNGAP